MRTCSPNHSPLTILDEKLRADPSRVVLRPFHLAWQSSVPEPSRAAQLVADVAALSEADAEAELALIWMDFPSAIGRSARSSMSGMPRSPRTPGLSGAGFHLPSSG